jgi:hypothetical protein
MRGSSPNILLGVLDEARICKHTYISIQYHIYEVQVKLLYISFMYYSYKRLKPKDCFKVLTLLAKVCTLTLSTFSSAWRRMPSLLNIRLRILVGTPTFIGLDLSLSVLVSIAGRRRISPTNKIDIKAKLERLRSIRLIRRHPKVMKLDM